MTLAQLLKEEGIVQTGAVRLEDCTVIKKHLIREAPTGCHVLMMVLPYPRKSKGSFASFSVIPDYHGFFSALEEKLLRFLGEGTKPAYARVFSDHSPIDERSAACRAGLGVRGDNGLFISKEYGSFVFLGELICSLTEDELRQEGISVSLEDERGCLHCGACRRACPSGAVNGNKELCVSKITQKKGDLSDSERDIIKKSGYVWGCDDCALVCPMNRISEDREKSFRYSDFFTSGTIAPQSYGDIEKMSDAEYGRYPFSWRKKDVLQRNFQILDTTDRYSR